MGAQRETMAGEPADKGLAGEPAGEDLGGERADEGLAGGSADGDLGGERPPAGPRVARSRWRGAAPRAVRLLRHEWSLAALGAVALAVLMTWPTLRHPASTIPQDTGDPTLQAWQVAWGGHALLTEPWNLWHSNTFFPERYTYAYSDTLLGYAPFGMFGAGPEAAVVRYNLLYVLVHALAFFGAYVLCRQLGAGRAGAAVAGAAFGYAPWKLAQAGHLHVLSMGGIALALAMLARGHGWSLRDGYRPERARPGWAVAGWLTAAWQVSIGFGIGLPFVYVLALLCLGTLAGYGISRWRRGVWPVFPRQLLVADLAGGLTFAAVTLLLAAPYFEVVARHPSGRRTVEQIAMFSPPLRGFLVAPPESWLWGERHAAAREGLGFAVEMTLLPGVVLVGLAAAGLFLSAWRIRHRVALAAAVLVSVALAAGSTLFGDGRPGYVTLMEHLPGWDALRTPGRLVLWTTLLLGVLAAGALTVRQEDARPVRWWQRPARLVLVVPLLLVLLEGVNRTPHAEVPPQPAALRGLTGPVLVLPSEGTREYHVMLWSTDGFPDLVNGGASFVPPSQDRLRAVSTAFPDPQAVAELRAAGIRTVVVLTSYVPGTVWQDVPGRPVSGPGVRVEQRSDGIVYHLE
ncbi:hypothetical protein [Micromonospora yangpuensis]|uniref:4-amino-4-deoxy-L-arabinose transferase n=1 Tax=Micromonospora yangpuensis TaxID=683228 RepID=A0A1C6V2Z4_9ACTN|nr:hypothetical protein [Micromonospora yangpuensis]GGL98502.1 hypothetical protein GCM10012279_15000 [Micromonospora yangpuensis]SCL60484.1 hypothetical protein GA0070617_4394 [Micromonospora yangpuensis]